MMDEEECSMLGNKELWKCYVEQSATLPPSTLPALYTFVAYEVS